MDLENNNLCNSITTIRSHSRSFFESKVSTANRNTLDHNDVGNFQMQNDF